MDSDFEQQQYEHHFQGQNEKQFTHQANPLTRFQSAPSSYFSSFLDGVEDHKSGDFSTPRPLSPETENIFAKFMSSMTDENNNNSSYQHKQSNMPDNLLVPKKETDTFQQQNINTGNSSSQQVVYRSQSKPPLARPSTNSSSSSMAHNTFSGGSMGMNYVSPHNNTTTTNNNNNSNSSGGLTRYSSSPAGFFSNILDIDTTGFGGMKSAGSYGGGDNTQMNFPTGQDLDVKPKVFNNDDTNYISEYPITSWDNSVISENLSTLDTTRDDAGKTFSEIKPSQNEEIGEFKYRPPMLSHHLSLPKMSADISTMEKLPHFQDSIPCRIRAKRGCATHPRSIAERLRRTKISERMRKLEALVPNMDKQTNTADMLDLAVDYIKDLQHQVKILNDNRAKCSCY